MRWLIAGSMVVVTACHGGGADDGALLVVSAPNGPGSAARVEIVLANAEAQARQDVEHQRVTPTDVIEQAVRYYRQRATAGFVDGVDALDGFVVRIAPNAAASADTEFIPFVLAYDNIDGVQVLAGIGVVEDGGEPTAIAVEPGASASYVVAMQPITEGDASADLGPGEALTVACPLDQNTTFRSGLAWQPGGGAQLRLLLPDLAADRGAGDATARALDLDCDGAEATGDDCDDLRADFHAGATEACDGRDTDCDAQRLELLPCTVPAGTCGAAASDGISVCDDPAATASACSAPPACQCASGNPGPCTKCVLEFAKLDDTTQAPCAPAVDGLGFAGCAPTTPCTIEVVPDPGAPWEAGLAKEVGQAFAPRVEDVTDGVLLRVKLLAPSVMSPGAGASVGRVILLIDDGSSSRSVGIDLELSGGGATICQPVNGVSVMQCG